MAAAPIVKKHQKLALYVHWPFCLARCPYCDFNSHVRSNIDHGRFAAALRRELATEAARLGQRSLTSIFFGGGTPSLMQPKLVAALLDDTTRFFKLADDIEITLEANPTSVEAQHLADFRSAGVNRISIGVQSLDPHGLHTLGRAHSVPEAVAAMALARNLFPRVSFDLIYARPGQTLTAWRTELRTALGIAVDHLSLYQLTIEAGTKFEALHRQGHVVLPVEELAAELYHVTCDECARVGMFAYEVSNYAAPGAVCRHNLTYWQYHDYAGIGPGAHGRTTIGEDVRATRRHRVPEVWAQHVELTGHGLTSDVPITAAERGREALLSGLRLAEGIDLAWFRTRTGYTVERLVDMAILGQLIETGYIKQTADRLIATRDGRVRLDSLLSALLL